MNTITSCCSLLRVNSSVLVNSVRYARKPRWVPMAKSKMYKIRELPYRPAHETEEITRLDENYRIYSASLSDFQRRITEERTARNLSVSNEGSEEAEWDKMVAEIERDNSIVKEIRERELVEEWKQIEADIKEQKALIEQKQLEDMLATEEKLKIQLAKLKDIITEANLDEAIEKALAKEVDYNFAIDKDDHIYQGRRNNKTHIDLEGIKEIKDYKIELPVSQ